MFYPYMYRNRPSIQAHFSFTPRPMQHNQKRRVFIPKRPRSETTLDPAWRIRCPFSKAKLDGSPPKTVLAPLLANHGRLPANWRF